MTTETTTPDRFAGLREAAAEIRARVETEEARPIEAARQRVTPLLLETRAVLARLDAIATTRAPALVSEAQRLLGTPNLDAVEGVRPILRGLREAVGTATEEMGRGREWLIKLTQRMEQLGAPGMTSWKLRDEEQAIRESFLVVSKDRSLAVALDSIEAALAGVEARQGEVLIIARAVALNAPLTSAAPSRVRAEFDAHGG